MNTSRIWAWIEAVFFGCCLSLMPLTAQAVDEIGLFELDANVEDAGGTAPDDWTTLCQPAGMPGGPCTNSGPAGGAFAFTGIDPDPAPQSIFEGGRKDIQPISAWSHKDGAVPDKSDITNAYAAAYLSTINSTDSNPARGGGPTHQIGDLVIYFGADRIINVGDTFMGFWFFKDAVSANEDGTFSGEHKAGDTLVLVNFPQANNAVPLVQVVEWDTSCSKADSNTPQEGDCAAANLRLKYGVSGAGAICSNVDDPQEACAITNSLTTDSAWPYVSKDGFVDEFPYETFFEGGINISALIGGNTCFASFMAETRSSSSFTASLKDFVLSDFPVCSTELRTEIHAKGDHVTNLDGGTADAGTEIHDAAFLKVTGPGTLTPSGVIEFTRYNAANCAGSGTVIATIDVSTGTVISGETRVETADIQYSTGAISFLAKFISSDGVLPNATAACENVTLNALNTTTVTQIHASGGHSPNLDGQTVFVGLSIHDFAKVTSTGVLPITGDVTFTLYDNGTCDGTPIGSFGTAGSQKVALNGSAEAETANWDTTGYLTTDANRSLSFKASYGGDLNYKPSVATCEVLTLKKYDPTIFTNIHAGSPASGHTIGTPVDIQGGSVTIGDLIHDIAAVTGAGPRPTGTVTFTLYEGNSCSGTVITQADPGKDLATDGKDYSTNGRTVESDVFNTAGYVPITLTNKSLSYKASYSGDGFYKSGQEATCEVLTVNKRLPSIATHVIVLDRARVGGDGGAVLPTGTVDFFIYSGTGCSGSPVQTVNNVPLVQSNGDLFATLADTFKTIISTVGTSSISYKAKYDGDANYIPVTHGCENVTVTLPAVTTGSL